MITIDIRFYLLQKMKKYLIIIVLFLAAPQQIWSQSLMTVQEVYNFDVGDIFISKGGGIYYPPDYIRREITGKYYNTTGDTVFYVYDQYKYTPQGCPNCPAVYDTMFGAIMSYTNLNDTIGSGLGVEPFYLSQDCIDTTGYTGVWVDSIYFDTTYCSRQITKVYRLENGPYLIDTCYSYFEPFFGWDDYGEGIGLKHHYYNTCSVGFQFCQEIYTLLYYKKGNDSCGVAPLIPLPIGIDEIATDNSIQISPNPFSSQTLIKFVEQQNNSLISIRNLWGTEVKQITFTGDNFIFDRDDLPAGCYFVNVISKNKVYSGKIVIQ